MKHFVRNGHFGIRFISMFLAVLLCVTACDLEALAAPAHAGVNPEAEIVPESEVAPGADDGIEEGKTDGDEDPEGDVTDPGEGEEPGEGNPGGTEDDPEDLDDTDDPENTDDSEENGDSDEDDSEEEGDSENGSGKENDPAAKKKTADPGKTKLPAAEEMDIPEDAVKVVGDYISTEADYNVPTVEYYSAQAFDDYPDLNGAIPSAYMNSLEQVTAAYPSTRAQSPYGLCWAFASTANAELSMIRQGYASKSVDYSEMQLAYYSRHLATDPMDGNKEDKVWTPSGNWKSGYNAAYVGRMMSQWVGVVNESTMPYSNMGSYATLNDDIYAYKQTQAILTDYRIINLRTNPELVKAAVMENGGVAVSYYDPDEDEYGNDFTVLPNFYYAKNTTTDTNHAVTIVGWDDNYSRTNFTKYGTPARNGAWLIRNSWSTRASLNGYSYMWMSYEEPSLANAAYEFTYTPAGRYDNNYQYDGSGFSISSGRATTANVFTVKGAGGAAYEELKAVGVEFSETNVEYTIRVYTNLKDLSDPTSGTLQTGLTKTGVTAAAGYYTFDLPKTIKMKRGSTFSVVVTTSGGYVTKEYALGGADWLAMSVGSAPHTSYYQYSINSSLGASWTEVSTSSGNFAIKAFTSDCSASEAGIYYIKFNGNGATGGSMPMMTDLEIGQEYQLPANAFTRTGYRFTGWNLREDGTGRAYADQEIVMDVTGPNTMINLYAQWESIYASTQYYVQFYGNYRDTSYHYMSTLKYGPYRGDQEFDLPDSEALTEFTRTGYHIKGWTTGENGTGTFYPTGARVSNLTMENGSVVKLYAVWEGDRFNLAFDAGVGSGTMSSRACQAGETFVLPKCTFTAPEGMVFSNWSTTPGGTGNIYADQQSVTLFATEGSTVTLYANWREIHYNIAFDGNGATSGTMSAQNNIAYSESVRLNSNRYQRTGYGFAGWYTNREGTGTSYSDRGTVSKLSAIDGATVTLYAKWQAHAYKIHFDANGGTGSMTDLKTTYGSYVTLPECGFEPGAGTVFAGWNSKADGTGTSYQPGDAVRNLSTEASAVVTLYAQWRSLFEMNASGMLTGYYGSEINLAIPDHDPVTGKTITGIGAGAFKANKNLYTVQMPVTVKKIETGAFENCSRLEAVTIHKYTTSIADNAFAGCGSLRYVFGVTGSAADRFAQAKGLTLIPIYDPCHYYITFDPNYRDGEGTGETTDQEIDSETLTALKRCGFAKVGHDFVSWNTEPDGTGTDYPAGTILQMENALTQVDEETVTLYAQWKPRKYTIGMLPGESSLQVTYEVTYGLSLEEQMRKDGTVWENICAQDGKLAEWIVVKRNGTKISEEELEWYDTSLPFTKENNNLNLVLKAVWYDADKLDAPRLLTVDGKELKSGDRVPDGTPVIMQAKDGAEVHFAVYDGIADTTSYRYGEVLELIDSGTGEKVLFETEPFVVGSQNPLFVPHPASERQWMTIHIVATKKGCINSDVKTYLLALETEDMGDIRPGELIDSGRDPDQIPEGLWAYAESDEGFGPGEGGNTAADVDGTAVYAAKVYTGTAVKPELRVYNGKKLLTAGVDYTLSYRNNVNASKPGCALKNLPCVTITGRGGYAGRSEKVYFRILPKQINSEDVLIRCDAVPANGKVQNPTVNVTCGTRKLVLNRDYNYTLPSGTVCKEAGTYPITVTGTGNYAGTKTVNYVITNAVPMSKVTVQAIPAQAYQNGAPIKPGLVVTYRSGLSSRLLVKGVDYEVEYRNNTAVGTASAIIKAINEDPFRDVGSGDAPAFFGTKTVSFRINGTPIGRASVSNLKGPFVYNGAAHTQDEAILKLDGRTLVYGLDYTTEYEHNVAAGTAVVHYVGIGGYTGEIRKTYQIRPLDLAELYAQDHLVINERSPIQEKYAKGGVFPMPEIRLSGSTRVEGKAAPELEGAVLVIGEEYTLSYGSNTRIGVPGKLTVKGHGNYKGSVVVGFDILGQDIGELQAAAGDVVFKNRTGQYKSAITVSEKTVTDPATGKVLYGGKILKAGTDYRRDTIRYTYGERTRLNATTVREKGEPVQAGDIPGPGTLITVTVDGMGSYSGSISATYRIVTASLASATISVKQQKLTRDPVKTPVVPKKSDITVKIGKKLLNMDDYEILTVTGNQKAGYATMVLRGKGLYGGLRTVKFKIVK